MAKDNISNKGSSNNSHPRGRKSQGEVKNTTTKTENKKPRQRTSKESKEKKPKTKGKKILKYSLITLLLLFLSVCVVGLGYVFAIIKTAPELDIEKIKKGDQATEIIASETSLGHFQNSEVNRTNLSSNEIPKNLKNAIVAIEDERFYEHKGIDVKRILGAVVYDVKYFITKKGGLQGASTLTQQLIKNTVLTAEKSAVERKVKELYLALQLEKVMSKDEILTAYLNNYPVGGTSYGAEAGAKYYFNKTAEKLNLIECAFLAGVTQSTHSYNPFVQGNKKETYLNRTKTVLMKMREHNFIDQKQYDKALKDIDSGKLKFKRGYTTIDTKYDDITEPTLAQVKHDLKAKYKYTDEEVNNLIANGGLQIYSTIDLPLQNSVQGIMDNFSNYNMYVADAKTSYGTPLIQGASTIVDNKTHEVKAMVGGRGKQPPKGINRAYDMRRSIGSTVKPFTSYGPALDTKVMTAASTVDDAHTSNLKQIYNGQMIQNSPATYRGLIPARESLKYSSNVGSVLTAHEAGVKTSISYGEKVGITFGKGSQTISAVATGQFENHPKDPDGGNPYIMAGAYSIFANGGKYVKPVLYKKVVDRDGNIILEPKKTEVTVMSPQAAYILYDMLKGPISYNASYARFGSMPVAGKTGTTDRVRDYWFGGLTPHYSGAVWVGYDNQTSLSGKGGGSGKTASALWGDIMKVANAGLSTKDIKMPSGIVRKTVCKDSGKLPTALCRRDQRGNRSYTELFIAGTEPTGYCETHVEAEVNKNNNLLANGNTPEGLRVSRVFIKKEHKSSNAADNKYILPTKGDNTVLEPETEEEAEDLEDQDTDDGTDGTTPEGNEGTETPGGGTETPGGGTGSPGTGGAGTGPGGGGETTPPTPPTPTPPPLPNPNPTPDPTPQARNGKPNMAA